MFTGTYCDTEGWPRFEKAQTREDLVEWFAEEGIDLESSDLCDKHYWNPTPVIIHPNHDHEFFHSSGYRYC